MTAFNSKGRHEKLAITERRKTEHFKALAKSDHSSAIADHVKTTGHDIKWDHFDILASGKTDVHCKIKETLFIQELKPSLNVNISSEKLLLVLTITPHYVKTRTAADNFSQSRFQTSIVLRYIYRFQIL